MSRSCLTLFQFHFLFLIGGHFLASSSTTAAPNSDTSHSLKSKADEDPSVTRFRDYLRLKAVHPDPDYASSIAWIKHQAEEIGLEYNFLQFDPPTNKFVIYLTWPGTNQSLPSILLNSHIDVVPVDLDKWTHDPWAAEKDEFLNIYGRGAQDMKCVGVQYLEAIRNFKSKGVTPLRNVHISYVPDEEIGVDWGMKLFVSTPEFQNLNVGFALDEGVANPGDEFLLMWAERSIWQVEFFAEGQAGHGSVLHNNTAMEKLQKVINSMLEVRTREKDRMESEGLALGEVTTINLTILKGGQQVNVVPSEMSATFDIRITPSWEFSYVKEMLDNVTTQAGPGVRYEFISSSNVTAQTPLTPDNIWWTTLESMAVASGIVLKPTIMSGGTDIRYVREIGVPAFGFSPMNKTPYRAHDNDEFLNENIFLQGIATYEQILPAFFDLTG